MSAIREIHTTITEKQAAISRFLIDENEILVYQPKDEMDSDIINHAYSAPLLLVFGDKKFDENSAEEYAESTLLKQIAAENGGSIVFLNPVDSWDNEPEGLYERVIAKCKVSQYGFKYGMLYDSKQPRNAYEAAAMKKEGFDPVPEYSIFASPVATYVYTQGKGADYFAKYYLREISGQNSMGDLGFAEITMTAITLQDLSIVPEVSCKDVSIVSVHNSQEINDALLASDNRVAVCDRLDVIDQYDKYIGDYKRWAGAIRKSVNYRKEGIVMKTQRLTVSTSPDNHSQNVKGETHEAGYVLFYDADLDLYDTKHPFPLLLCFHGGGDTAIATAIIGEWPQIAKENGFLLCAVEMHMDVTASETMQIVAKLEEEYAIDTTRIYATGFSMGGIKSWDMAQEYPEVMAAVAPMDATVDVGENCQFGRSPKVNQDILVPVFYNGGENSPLAETPNQELKCLNRLRHTFKVNKVVKSCDFLFSKQEEWEDRIYAVKADEEDYLIDPDYPDSVTDIRYYVSEDGNIYTAFCSISNHQHEIRPFTCRQAWKFISQFSRQKDGSILIRK